MLVHGSVTTGDPVETEAQELLSLQDHLLEQNHALALLASKEDNKLH